MGLLLLFCLTVLTGCGDNFSINPLDFSIPANAVPCGEFPAPPSSPLDCMDDAGNSVLCQSDVAVWVETEVKPAYDDCKAAYKFWVNRHDRIYEQ